MAIINVHCYDRRSAEELREFLRKLERGEILWCKIQVVDRASVVTVTYEEKEKDIEMEQFDWSEANETMSKHVKERV